MRWNGALSQQDLHVEWRAALALLSNLLDLVFTDERTAAVYASSTMVKTHKALTDQRGYEPFDKELLVHLRKLVKPHLLEAHPALLQDCKFLRSLMTYKPPKLDSLTPERILESIAVAEARSQIHPWGESKIALDELSDLDNLPLALSGESEKHMKTRNLQAGKKRKKCHWIEEQQRGQGTPKASYMQLVAGPDNDGYNIQSETNKSSRQQPFRSNHSATFASDTTVALDPPLASASPLEVALRSPLDLDQDLLDKAIKLKDAATGPSIQAPNASSAPSSSTGSAGSASKEYSLSDESTSNPGVSKAAVAAHQSQKRPKLLQRKHRKPQPMRGSRMFESDETEAVDQIQMPTTLALLSPMESHVSKLIQGTDYDQNLSLRVILAAMRLQKEYLLRKSKKMGHKIPPAQVQKTVCRLLGVPPQTYSRIVSGYLQDGSIYSTGVDGEGRGGNTQAKETRIPRTPAVSVAVREFIDKEWKKQKRVTARQLLDFFVESGILHIPTNQHTGLYQKKDFQAASRNVRRYVEDGGYLRRWGNNLTPDRKLIIKRHEYLHDFFAYQAMPKAKQYRNVYVDECFICEHHHKTKSESDIEKAKSKHTGQQYHFVVAVQGPDPKVDDPKNSSEKAGLVPGTVWGIHCGNHQGFDCSNFSAWWKGQLLPNLHQPSLIQMDNAEYHKGYGSEVPKWNKLSKQECIEFLLSKGIEIGPLYSAIVLKTLVKDWIFANEKYECVRLAEELGHKVLFIPPYHSDLQPLELIWADIKGKTCRNSSLELMHQTIMRKFQNLQQSGQDTIQDKIGQCVKKAEEFYSDIPAEDAAEKALTDKEANCNGTVGVTLEDEFEGDTGEHSD